MDPAEPDRSAPGDLQAVPSGVSGAAPVDTGASAMVEVTSEETNAGFELPGEALAVIVRGDSVRSGASGSGTTSTTTSTSLSPWTSTWTTTALGMWTTTTSSP